MPRVSLDVGYNRRWWGNYTVTDNLAVGPADYEKWVINAPKHPRLPNGGGYPVAVYTQTAAAGSRSANNWTVLETDFGPSRINYWQGVDVTVNARMRGVVIQAGTTTGRSYVDTCATALKIDSPDPRNCLDVDPVETTLRGLASYTVPRVDVRVSATMRSQPRLPLTATYVVPNTVVQSILGRLPPGGLSNGNTNVALLDNGTRLYADSRRTQFDMRFAKVLRFSGRRLDVGADLYNLLNTNYATAYEGQYDYNLANGGAWNNPTTILPPRFVRVNLTLNF
jgi:hypothetical protein